MKKKKKEKKNLFDFISEKKLSDMTPEEIKEMNATIRASMKEPEDKGPPETPAGKCVVCSCGVRGEYIRKCRVPAHEMILGPGSKSQFAWVFQGYSCIGCGLMYKFLPPNKTL